MEKEKKVIGVIDADNNNIYVLNALYNTFKNCEILYYNTNTVEKYEGLDEETFVSDVKNSIEDVFRENDTVSNIQCYFKPELKEFQHDLQLFNNIKMYVDGHSIGSTMSVFTYYGQMNFSLSERTELLERTPNGDESVELITDIDNSEIDSVVYDPNEYEVILYEVLTWNTPDKPVRTTNLFIYCPADSPEDEIENEEAASNC